MSIVERIDERPITRRNDSRFSPVFRRRAATGYAGTNRNLCDRHDASVANRSFQTRGTKPDLSSRIQRHKLWKRIQYEISVKSNVKRIILYDIPLTQHAQDLRTIYQHTGVFRWDVEDSSLQHTPLRSSGNSPRFHTHTRTHTTTHERSVGDVKNCFCIPRKQNQKEKKSIFLMYIVYFFLKSVFYRKIVISTGPVQTNQRSRN